MAPRYGGGSSGSICPGAFQRTFTVIIFVSYCLFIVLNLLILLAWIQVRKSHANAKKLLGWAFLASLLFNIIYYILSISNTVAVECAVSSTMRTVYSLQISSMWMYRLSNFFLLVVVVWGVNRLLQSQTGDSHRMSKIMMAAALGFMALLTVACAGLSTYNNVVQMDYYTDGYRYNARSFYFVEQIRLSLTYLVFYLLIVLASGALSVMTLMKLKRRQHGARSILPYIIGLTASMFIWLLLDIVTYGFNVTYGSLSDNTIYAFLYITQFFLCVSYIMILMIAKKAAFKPVQDVAYDQPHSGADALVPTYAHMGPGVVQHDHHGYQSQPAYAGPGVVR